MTRTRMQPIDREAQLLAAAIKLAKRVGYRKVTRVAVAAATGTTEGLINRYFGGKQGMRDAIMRNAVFDGQLQIVAQGLMFGDPIAKKAPVELREAAAKVKVK